MNHIQNVFSNNAWLSNKYKSSCSTLMLFLRGYIMKCNFDIIYQNKNRDVCVLRVFLQIKNYCRVFFMAIKETFVNTYLFKIFIWQIVKKPHNNGYPKILVFHYDALINIKLQKMWHNFKYNSKWRQLDHVLFKNKINGSP